MLKPKNMSQKMPELRSFEGFVGILSYCFHDILYVFLSGKMHKDIDMQVGTKGLGLGDTLLFCQLPHSNNLKQTFDTEPRHTFFSLKCFPRDQMPQKLLGKCSRCDLEIFFNA